MSRPQLRSIAGALTTPQIALWSGAVASGKTIASLVAFLLLLVRAPRHGLVVIVGRTLQTIERNIIDVLQSPELFGPVAAHVHHTPGSTTAVILGRTVHLIGASDARAEGRIRGATVGLAYVDEASLIPESFWTMLLSRLRVKDARLLGTTNPDGPAHWLRKDYILRADEVGMRHWHFTLDDNPGLPEGFADRLKVQYVGLWYRRFIAGEWCLASGAVYDMWDPDRHVVSQLPTIREWIGTGVDYGTVNPFAALLGGLGDDGRIYLASEYRYDSRREYGQLTDHEYSRRYRAWLDGLGVRPRWHVVDPSASSFIRQLMTDRVTAAHANNDVLDGIRTVSSLLGTDRLRVHESCAGWIDEAPGYSWDDDAAEKGEDRPVKANDHSLDGGRYLLHTTHPTWRIRLRPAALAA
ncbi:PBSX family phage terminase large subunit [Streptomonospora sp. PA3]|nr:PBSX family phage terminase large subunit [Streptomonospora sp. PA3]MUL39619.1 PBSX family phage terminase large subunit [Streptomonospora sp. PA3]